jgi:hypothetical protein
MAVAKQRVDGISKENELILLLVVRRDASTDNDQF